MNAVHPYHHSGRFHEGKRHFVLAFHDSTFECVAEGYAISVHVGSMAGALPEMSRRMGCGAPAT